MKIKNNAGSIFVVCVEKNWVLQAKRNNTGHFNHFNSTTGSQSEIPFPVCNHATTSWKFIPFLLKSQS